MPVKRACTAASDGARRSSRLQAKRMRPMPGHKPHDVQQGGAGRDELALRRSAHGPEARRGLIPGLARVNALREIRHEEHVKMRQVIGHILRREDEVLQARAVFGRG